MEEKQKQALFLERIQEVVKSASQNGNMISEEELQGSFADLSLSEAQMGQVREYLKGSGIGIGEALPIEEVLSEEEINHLAEYEALIEAIEVPAQLAPLEKPDEVDGYLGRRIMDAMEDLVASNLDEKAAEKAVEERVNLVADRARELAEELGRKVSVAELAREYDMDPEDIQEAVRLSGNAIGDIG